MTDKTIREIKIEFMDGTTESLEPFIIIYEDRKVIDIIINQTKLFRILNEKNVIQTQLDTLLVDKIKQILKEMAMREQEAEEELKKWRKQNGDEISERSRTEPDDKYIGRSGDQADSGRFA